jgi:hypothetical protein
VFFRTVSSLAIHYFEHRLKISPRPRDDKTRKPMAEPLSPGARGREFESRRPDHFKSFKMKDF